jgi:hypothetical protein
MEKVPVPSSAGLVARQENRGRLQVTQQLPQATRYAFIGVRSCELHAIAIQDRALTPGRTLTLIIKRPGMAFLWWLQLWTGGRHLLLCVNGHRTQEYLRVRPGPDRSD